MREKKGKGTKHLTGGGINPTTSVSKSTFNIASIFVEQVDYLRDAGTSIKKAKLEDKKKVLQKRSHLEATGIYGHFENFMTQPMVMGQIVKFYKDFAEVEVPRKMEGLSLRLGKNVTNSFR